MNDDDLRARLRAADPARHLSGPRTLELTEAMMSTQQSAAMSRKRFALAAAAVAVLVLAGLALIFGAGKAHEPVASPKASPSKALTTATYTLQAGQAMRCAPPDVNTIRGLDVAFQGKVASAGKSQIDLVPSSFYTGARTDRVVLSVHSASGANPEMLPVSFTPGKDYIVGVKNGSVLLCGYSGEASPSLAKLYARALGKP